MTETFREKPFQFSLFQLFLLTTAACFLYSAGQLFGSFLTSLLLGLLVISVVISLLGIENLILGGLLGVVLAVVILFATTLLCMLQEENEPGGKLLGAMFLYPLYGYLVGLFSTADKTMDSD